MLKNMPFVWFGQIVIKAASVHNRNDILFLCSTYSSIKRWNM